MKVRPNLIDSSQLTPSFDWQALERELGLIEATNYNLAYAAIDRHLTTGIDKTALLWEGKSAEQERYTFGDLALLTNKFANVLLSIGVKKGDRVLYLWSACQSYMWLYSGPGKLER